MMVAEKSSAMMWRWRVVGHSPRASPTLQPVVRLLPRVGHDKTRHRPCNSGSGEEDAGVFTMELVPTTPTEATTVAVETRR